MDFSPKKLKIDKININNMQERNLKSYLDYFQKNKITHKKKCNSSKLLINKRKKLAIKYNLTDNYIYSVINKTFRKKKTPLLEFENDNKSNNILESLVNKNYINLKTIRKTISFKDDNKNYNLNNINNINIEENIISKKMQKFKTFKDLSLPFQIKTKKEFKKDDFDVLALCGKGAYATVIQVKLKNEQDNKQKNSKKIEDKYYAIKVIDINSMKKVNKIYQIYLESEILNELNNPYIVKIFGTFQTTRKVYMVLEYLSNGNFATFLKNNYPLNEDTIKFYSAEIVSFLEYLQSQSVVHRDLKPENIMINEKYHLQMIDFATVRKVGFYYDKTEMKFKKDDYDMDNDTDDIKGTKLVVNPDNDDDDDNEGEESDDNDINDIYFNSGKKIKNKKPKRNKTFVGTAEYVSPEVISDQPAEYGADLWAFGVILYQMYCGQTPFKSATNYLTFKNIEKMQITYPDNIIMPEDAKDLINKILLKDPNKRLGAGKTNTEYDMVHLKKHPFFKGTKWKNLFNQNVPNTKTFKFKNNKKVLKTIKNNQSNKDDKNDLKVREDNKKIIIIKEGTLFKKSFLFYSEIFLSLDSTPRITYKNANKNEISGIINLNKKCRVFASKSDIFNIETPEKSYKFKTKSNDLIIWINAIKDCIKKYGNEE